MKKENSRDFETDNLLKKILRDDLPPELESSMKKQLILFREKMERSEQQRRKETYEVLWRLFHGEGLKWMQWMFKKQVLASVSIIMVLLGGALQITGPRSVLARSISLLKTSVFVSNQVLHAGSMECSVQVPAENDKPLEYSIQWLSPDRTRVQVAESSYNIIKTLWLLNEEITIADHNKKTLRKVKNIEQINDPQFQHVMGFLSPFDLAERMDGKWQLRQYKQQGECERETYTITIPEETAFLEVIIDLCTYLPINIKKFLPDSTKKNGEAKMLMNIHFKWNTPIPPQIMLPKITVESMRMMSNRLNKKMEDIK